MKKSLVILAAATMTIGLSACGSMNKIDRQGNIVNKEVKWGNPKYSTFKTSGTMHGGVQSVETLKLVHAGQTKAQILGIQGRPHYSEGFSTHEWNYIWNFYQPDGSYKQCQEKITFDSKMNSREPIWYPADCLVQPEPQTPIIVVPKEQPKPVEQFSLNSDFLFSFDKYTLKPEGVTKLSSIVDTLKQKQYNQIVIVGHTDRLGSDNYNQKLSEKRAITVAKFMTERGVPSEKIRAFGAGESTPVKECAGTKPTPELKACLAENRRVEIEVH